MDPMVRLAVVLGTYNRLVYLRECVASIRQAVKPLGQVALEYTIVVVDGGSTDGSRTWLAEQPDIIPIGQLPPLTGAVIAFNLGFGLAVDGGYDYIANFNDDAYYLTPGMLSLACAKMEADAGVGAIAFHFDLPGRPDGFEYINGLPYANFGVTRRDAGMQVARAQGDPLGRKWWNPIYHTYGADSEFGAWLWRLGWRIEKAPDLCVQDAQADDELRHGNTDSPRRLEDGKRFWRRWPSREHILHLGPAGDE
jgi:glycosyltransferase involved in cell wall biosynthesis